MNRLNPKLLFERIATDIPQSLQSSLIVAGSLAAAYEFRTRLQGNAVNTKDADLVIHPAGNEASCVQMTTKLLGIGWTRTEQCFPQAQPKPVDQLRAIRLYPPKSTDYFIEFLNVPQPGQQAAKDWVEVQLSDGWYGLPTFRFLGVVTLRHTSRRQELSMPIRP